ncbi:MAG: HAD-IIB family hydrolase [Gammaproteobacteria bacterium]|jgi:hypothetical protein|nr:HAD-IIB family hydrolase [Gammaproteobacteria bacterium]MDP6165554.1 HAD-IIB family hydrolase [Gammaproteobacteria bacterium]
MQPLSQLPLATARSINFVFADIDDTITTEGCLSAASYTAIENLTAAGIRVIPVTGRPAGWCDLIARLWPVAGVVGENGAFYYAYQRADRSMVRVFAATEQERSRNRQKLTQVREQILAEVSGSAVAADQSFRDTDLAIDFCEDVAPLADKDVQRIQAIFEAAGAVAKISSIHVNGWFGTHDKLTMTQRFCREILKVELHDILEEAMFVGDSPNDAPMFAHFKHAFGVDNVRDFAAMDAYPAWLSKGRGGEGFVEIAHCLLTARGWL